MRHAIVMTIVLSAASALAQQSTIDVLVKHPTDVRVTSSGGPQYVIVDPAMSLIGRTPVSPAPAFDPTYHDANRVTTAPFFNLRNVGRCPYWDDDGDGRIEAHVGVHYLSLLDLGTHRYEAIGPSVLLSCCTLSGSGSGCTLSCQSSSSCVLGGAPNVWTANVFNNPPTAQITSNPAPRIGGSVTLNGNAFDPDPGLPIAFAWGIAKPRPDAPATANFDYQAATPTITFNHEKDIGTWHFNLTVADRQGQIFTFPGQHVLTVPNAPPTLTISGPAQLDVGQTLTLTATGSDPDGGALTIQWRVVSAPATSGQQPGIISTGTFGRGGGPFVVRPQDLGRWEFNATATDNEGASVTSNNVVVQTMQVPPVLNVTYNTQFYIGDTLAFTAAAHDPDGGTLQPVRWWVTNAPPSAQYTNPIAIGNTFNRNGMPFVAQASDLSHKWRVDVSVTDDEGSTTTKNLEFRIDNRPPTINLAGQQPSYNIGQTLAVTATATDPDGGPVTIAWYMGDVSNVEKKGTPIATGPTLERNGGPFVATAADVGDLKITAAATDDEGGVTCAVLSTVIKNLPPRIELADLPKVVAVGDLVTAETTVTTDDDGGPLTFEWELVQYPASFGMPPTFPDTAAIQLFTTPSAVGTWILKLTARDDDNAADSSVSAEVEVTVDGLPVVGIVGQSLFTATASGVTLDADALDPDSPCPNDWTRCHYTLFGGSRITDGILEYEWTVLASPLNMAGPLSAFFPGVAHDQARLQMSHSAVAAGAWTFGVTVKDGEGNLANAQKTVMVAPNTPPTLVFVPPSDTLIDPGSGRLTQAIVLDASHSVDGDNRFLPMSSSGIVAVQWDIVSPPHCGSGRFQVIADSFELFAAQTVLPPGCAGEWLGEVVIADDDVPSKEASATFAFKLTSCPTGVCIDSPRTLAPWIVQGWQWPVSGSYRLDESLLDRADFLTSAMARFEITSKRGTVRQWDEPIAPISGAPLSFTWDGTDQAGHPVPADLYGVRVTLIDTTGLTSGFGADRAPDSMYVERLVVSATPPAEGILLERIEAGLPLPAFAVAAGGWHSSLPYGFVHAKVMLQATVVKDFGYIDVTQPLVWDGRSDAALPPAQPGDHMLKVEAIRFVGGVRRVLATAFAPFPVYGTKLVATAAGYRGPGTVVEPLVEWWEGMPPVVDSGNFGSLKRKMTPVTVEARRRATVTLALEAGGAPVHLFQHDGTPLGSSKSWGPGDFVNGKLSVQLLAYAGGLGNASVKLSYADNGQVLTEERLVFRMDRQAALAGVPTPGGVHPFFLPLGVFQAGDVITTALDPVRHRERVGKTAAVYIVPHRTLAEWDANPSLASAVAPPADITLPAGSQRPQVATAWSSATVAPSSLITSHGHQEFDVVYDFGNFAEGPAFVPDGRLDPGDILDSVDPASFIVDDYSRTLFGVKIEDYGTRSPDRFHVPSGYAGLLGASGRDVALAGRLVHPSPLVPGRRYPLVVFAHGYHVPFKFSSPAVSRDENYRGHTYLQEYLAARGYMSVSVDLDQWSDWIVTPGMSAIRLRAWTVLKNIEHALTRLDPAVASAIDVERLFFVGHSRGGEAVVDAVHLLGTSADWPPGETLNGSGKWRVKGVVSLAPTTWELAWSTGIPASIPYLAIHGSADGDVHGAVGSGAPFQHYDRARGDKFGIRLLGANHNFFNTSWVMDDAQQDRATGNTLPTPVGHGLMTDVDQRALAQELVTSFFVAAESPPERAWWLAQLSHATRNIRSMAASLVVQSRLPLARLGLVLDDYEGTHDEALSSSNAVVSWNGMSVHEDALMDTAPASEVDLWNRFFQATSGGLLSWSGPAHYSQTVYGGWRDWRGYRFVSMRLAQRPPSTCVGAPSFPVIVALTDGASVTRAVSSTVFGEVAAVYKAEAPGSPNGCSSSAMFSTLRIPIGAFTTDTLAGLDLSTIADVTVFVGAAPGVVAIDDLTVER